MRYFLSAAAGVVVGGWLLHAFFTPALPRILLRDGGEIRVYNLF